jgi:hypothetical protein
MSSHLTMDDIALLDRQIEQLLDYKPIPEHEVKQLCDKVSCLAKKAEIIGSWIYNLAIS